jgi:hypothetical protein
MIEYILKTTYSKGEKSFNQMGKVEEKGTIPIECENGDQVPHGGS